MAFREYIKAIPKREKILSFIVLLSNVLFWGCFLWECFITQGEVTNPIITFFGYMVFYFPYSVLYILFVLACSLFLVIWGRLRLLRILGLVTILTFFVLYLSFPTDWP